MPVTICLNSTDATTPTPFRGRRAWSESLCQGIGPPIPRYLRRLALGSEVPSRSRRRWSVSQQNLFHVLACLRIDDDEIDPLCVPRPQMLDGFELQEFVVENRALGISVSVKRDDPGHVASLPRSPKAYH